MISNDSPEAAPRPQGRTAIPAQAEYDQAHEWWRQLSNMRRQDLAMFTTIQGAAITIVGDQLLSLDVRGLALSIIAFLVAVIGLNNERNLNSHLIGFRQRAIELEDEHGASLVRAGMDQAKKTPGLMLTHSTFRAYYVLLVIGWVVIWILNI